MKHDFWSGAFRRFVALRTLPRHPERGRSSGGAGDLARSIPAIVAKLYWYPSSFGRVFVGLNRCAMAALLMSLLAPMLAIAQAGSSAAAAEKVVAPGMSGAIRYTETLQVTRKGKGSIAVQAELAGWVSTNGSREIIIPPRGFYIVTLLNDSAVTVINGEETRRTAGEIWAVQDGQSMTVRIRDPKQENVSLEILSLRPGH
jgi:hypothetical protein